MDPLTIVNNAPMLLGATIVGLLGFVILLAVGLNLWGRERRTKDGAGGTLSAPEEKKPGFQLPIPAAVTERLAPRAAPVDPNANEVLRVLRDKLTGRVLVEINGKRFGELSEVKESDVRRALLLTLRDLQEFVGVSATTVGASVSPAAPVAPVVPAPTAFRPSDSAPAIHLNPAPLPKAQPEASEPLRTPTMNLFRQFAVAREMSAKELPPLKSLAQQIDDVLQHVIAGTPFAVQNLHVASGPNDSVIFEIGTQIFNSVDEIPDATLQTVFREAIRRWEQQQ